MTQKRFEGTTLAAVLAKVQKEIGPAAKILSAQKARTGGVMGFFQRERFEVLVELPPAGTVAAPTPTPAPAPASPTSLLDLAEQVNTTEGGETNPSTAPAATTPEPKVSTETSAFADVLSRMAFQADMHSDTSPAQTTEDDEDEEETPIEDWSNILDQMHQQADQRDSRSEPPQPVAHNSIVPDRPAFLDPSPAPASAHEAEVPKLVEPANQIERVQPELRTRATDHPLAVLGVPLPYIPVGIEESGLQQSLTAAFEKLPTTPDITPSKGSIVAVVGKRSDATAVAHQLAAKWDRPKEEIVVASQHSKDNGEVLRSVRSAEDARRSWKRRDRPTIVVIEAHPGSPDSIWAEHMLSALEPIATYGVADATRKPEDISRWAQTLGGLDCLAITHVERTVSPASVLATGIPIDRIDGRPATASYWAMLLSERLAPT